MKLPRLFKRDRRKDLALRALIDQHEHEAEEFRKTADKLIAVLNGDEEWLVKTIKEDKEDGHNSDCVLDNSS